ncbi:MAG: hypothetical protein ABSG25_12845 [Bryobacteraceae bacterium]
MNKIYNCDWIDVTKINSKCDIIFYNNIIPERFRENGIKILFAFSEPEEVRCSNKEVIDNKDKFELIVANDEEILTKCNNAVKFIYGGCWVSEFVENKKEAAVSFLCGDKIRLSGHKIRHEIYTRKNEILSKNNFFDSKLRPYKNELPIFESIDRKNELFRDISHHICIENVKRNNWFTEKLIDCFITKTIPIYWGAPNIDKYFNINGIIMCNDSDDIINACNKISLEDYNSKLVYIEDNYYRALEYNQHYNHIITRLNRIIKEKIK